MKWAVVGGAALVLAGCAGGASVNEPPGQAVELTAAQRTDVEQGVRRGLKDPASAMFGEGDIILPVPSPIRGQCMLAYRGPLRTILSGP